MSRTRSLKLTLEDLPVEATADGPAPLRVEIFNSIRASGVETKTIEGIECLSQKLWFVVFYERRHRNIYENKQIKLDEKEYFLTTTEPVRPARPQFVCVKLFEYPLDAKAEILKQRLGIYGELIDITDDKDKVIKISKIYHASRTDSLLFTQADIIYARHTQDRRKRVETVQSPVIPPQICCANQVKYVGSAVTQGHNKINCPEKRCYFCKEKGHPEQSKCVKYVAEYPEVDNQNNLNME